MKTKLLILAILIGTPFLSQAQFRVGPSVGFNFSTAQLSDELKNVFNFISADDFSNGMLLRAQIGVLGEYELNDELYLQSGLLVNGKGSRLTGNTEGLGEDISFVSRSRLTYLSIPLTARYQFTSFNDISLSAFAGFYIDMALSGSVKVSFEEDGEKDTDTRDYSFGANDEDQFKRADLSLSLGITAESENLPVQVKLALVQGLTNIYSLGNEYPELGWNNFGVSLSAAYFFELP